MRRILFFLFFLSLSVVTIAQSYDRKEKYGERGTFIHEVTPTNKINVTLDITRQLILTHADFEQKQKTVSELPKYRFELLLTSNSTYNNKTTKTWLYGARVFINGIEVTKEQFPNGFTAIVETTPTVIYWYETTYDKIIFKITWADSVPYWDKL